MKTFRDSDQGRQAAAELGLEPSQLTHLEVDLADLESVRSLVEAFHASGLLLDALICNAAVYKPRLKQPERSPQRYEISMATNHLGHFLLIQLLLPDLQRSGHPSRRLVILGTVTAKSKELGGGRIPIPAPADLSGFAAGFKAPVSMANGKTFNPGKAYKASKLCNMIITQALHRRPSKRSSPGSSARSPVAP